MADTHIDTSPDAGHATPKGKELTGRKVFLITASFFAVIIAVNLYMASQAIGTFPGLEVKNTYVASQEFDRNRAAQLALGWTLGARIEGEELHMMIQGPDGTPVSPDTIEASLGRSTHTRDDQALTFTRGGDGGYVSSVGELAPGNWNLRLKAYAADGTLYQKRVVIYLSER